MIRANSVRPAPTSPANPKISPAFTSIDRSVSAMAWRPLDSRAREMPSTAKNCFAGARRERPFRDLHVAADHETHQIAGLDVFHLAPRNIAAVAQHRETVANPLYFIQPVRDVDKAHAARLEIADDAVQDFDFAAAQGGGRLIHDDELGLVARLRGRFRPFADGRRSNGALPALDRRLTPSLPAERVHCRASRPNR